MQKNFDLETILIVTSDISLDFIDNYYNEEDLACFIYGDDAFTPVELGFIRKHLKKHLLNIHPELLDVVPSEEDKSSYKNWDAWIEEQKMKFGDTLPICKINEVLEETEINKGKGK